MLKKKNIAMVMAAATIATSVAPVFALEAQSMSKEAIIKEVGEKLAVKYTDKDESVYKIETVVDSKTTPVTTVNELKLEIEKAEIAGKAITVNISDKGHKEVNGKIVNTIKTKEAYADDSFETGKLDSTSDATVNTVGVETIKTNSNGVITGITVDESKHTATITLASGVEIVVATGTAKLDLTTGLDKDGQKVNIANIGATDSEAAKRVVGFDHVVDTTNASNNSDAKIPARNISSLVYGDNTSSISKELKFKLEDFITENGYTQMGKELMETIGKANGDANNGSYTPVNVINNGKKYIIEYTETDNLKVESVKDGGYQLTVEFRVSEHDKDRPVKPNVKLVLTSNVQNDLVSLKTAIDSVTNSTIISVGKYDKLAGDNRFETAVEISKKSHDTNETANAIVLVGENAVVDGLASAPLAKQKEAPILLTKKDSIPAATMNEIKRAAKNGAVIYLVGGENTISKAVETELAKVKNFKTLRLAGKDRYETSLKIADELNIGSTSTAFVVGGSGLADAMSVAPVAAQKEDPIIVTPKDGLTREASKFLKDTANITKVDVIGGTSNVSTQVLKDINDVKSVLLNRIAGDNRNDTNAKVLANNDYFSGDANLDLVYVAKDADTQLVDALAAAPLAGSTTKGAIVLATNDLTKAQEDALKAKTSGGSNNKATQIGNGISLTVMQKVLKALGL